jgi:hypothetical protein
MLSSNCNPGWASPSSAVEFDIFSEWTVPVDVRLYRPVDEPGSTPSWDWREGR